MVKKGYGHGVGHWFILDHADFASDQGLKLLFAMTSLVWLPSKHGPRLTRPYEALPFGVYRWHGFMLGLLRRNEAQLARQVFWLPTLQACFRVRVVISPLQFFPSEVFPAICSIGFISLKFSHCIFSFGIVLRIFPLEFFHWIFLWNWSWTFPFKLSRWNYHSDFVHSCTPPPKSLDLCWGGEG